MPFTSIFGTSESVCRHRSAENIPKNCKKPLNNRQITAEILPIDLRPLT